MYVWFFFHSNEKVLHFFPLNYQSFIVNIYISFYFLNLAQFTYLWMFRSFLMMVRIKIALLQVALQGNDIRSARSLIVLGFFRISPSERKVEVTKFSDVLFPDVLFLGILLCQFIIFLLKNKEAFYPNSMMVNDLEASTFYK